MTAVARALTDQCAGYVLELRQNGAQIASQAWNYAINGSQGPRRIRRKRTRSLPGPS